MIKLSNTDDGISLADAGRKSGRFAGKLGRRRLEEADPMAGIANLVDVMLVFACALIIALLVYWNLDIPDIREIQQRKEITDVEDMDKITQNIDSDETAYKELGSVYEDPETGKSYLVVEEDED